MALFFKTTFTIFSFIITLCFCEVNLYGQDNASNSIYDWFDNKVGKENLDINNGKLLLNYDKVLNENDRFYFRNYLYGTVVYDNQIYNNVILNYDILKDDLIIKPYGEFDKNPIILTREKINYFTVEGINFINLNYSQTKIPDFITGYYEESFVGNDLIFYAKHIKTKSEKIYGDKIYDDFTPKNYYLLNYKNNFYEISSKKSIVSIFPEYKKMISEFYSNNEFLEKSNKQRFLYELFNNLNAKLK